ncbi:MAG: M48 family metallopeptidase [Desulfobulbaceae bacterium]|nr:M48 family metallopeptidase [Desulfobulbaceae bacterium]
MANKKTSRLLLPWLLFLLAGIGGCETAANVGASLAASTGVISYDTAQSLAKASVTMAKAFTDITPEQEYYIGRAVAATVLSRYRPHEAGRQTLYLNTLGQTLATASARPQTFGGYHFLILDTDEINAFAAPGGLIFVSRGLLRCCRSEDAVAAVLAHEIGHVQQKHGLQAIQKGRLTEALTAVAAAGAKEMGGPDLARLTTLFEESIKDVTATLINNGYSRELEREADTVAVTLLQRLGYDPHALADMLAVMEQRLPPGGPGFARTHPAPSERLASLEGALAAAARPAANRARQQRFQSALGGV